MGFLKQMGLEETIADDAEEYVRIAARLGTDTKFRETIIAKVSRNKRLVYRDSEPIRALEKTLIAMCDHA